MALDRQAEVGTAPVGYRPADVAYRGPFREWMRNERGWRVEVPRHPDRQSRRYGLEEEPRGFQVLPRRWVIEMTFAWLGHARRLAWTTRGCQRRRWP